ncbi:MAG: MBL fold metallo-hydrolase [Alphaproteobacteria bacterium]|nr:MBL fold metallo-hydrolase [Alphaproteobacteria bacterium]
MRMLRWAIFAVVGIAGAGLAALYFIPAVQDRVIAGIIDDAFSRQRDDLVGEDALRVAICGSGSPMSNLERSPACHLVFAAGKIFVVDAGPGSWMHVTRWQVPQDRVAAVLLTHFHSDHIGDLGEVNLQTWVAQRPQRLAVYGGPGIDRVVAGFNEAYAMDRSHRMAHHGPEFLRPDLGEMEAHLIAAPDGTPLRGDEDAVVYDDGALKITAFAVHHDPVVPAYGYRFDYRGRSLVFSGDTAKSDSLVRHAQGADVLIHEAMLKTTVAEMEAAAARHGRTPFAKILHDIPDYHASPRDAAETAAEAGVAHLVLSHLIPPLPHWLGARVFLRDTGVGQVDVRLGYDGMLITLPAGSKDAVFEDLGR